MMRPKMPLALVLFVVFLLGTSSVSSAGPFGVELLRPDSLAGWENGQPPPQGWRIEEGRLSGTATSTPLLSAWTLGDFELRTQWSVADDGQLKLFLPNVPAGKGLELTLCEGEHCGRLTEGKTELASGTNVNRRRKRKMHSAVIHREGKKLDFTVDDQWIWEVEIDAQRRFGLGLAVAGGSATLTNLHLQEPPGEPMFNGKDLTGWYTNGDITKWLVKGNQVLLTGRPHDYLRTRKEYANFTWSFDVKMRKRGNSGLSIRTPHEGWPTADGMELQLFDAPYTAEIKDEPYMAIYGHVPPLGRVDKSQKWNHIVVKADGYMITAWVNGQMVQQVNSFHHPELKHRHLQGWLGFQDHGAWIRVRNVRILEAPGGLGMRAWRRPRPPSAVTAILDRLINPERLSVADGIDSAVAFKTFSGKEPSRHVLAQLTGPGAVVRIVRAGDEGRLAFYFDGEKEPRIECPPAELPRALPLLGKDANPMLTCLTYKKSLKIVLDEAAQGEYRLDYVKLPKNLPLESFTDPESGFPRGWLDAAATLLRWLGAGRFHEYDPLPRFGGKRQTIEPGASVPLAQVDGVGIVKMLKLLADKNVLDNNDLWLEVTIDGEKRPAISAPVRYLFPALERNYDNYVLADQGGPTSMLAMPFGDGITVSVANRGGRPLENVGISLAVQRATKRTQNDIASRMRLRGIFLPAREGTNRLLQQKGTGRWVGFVYQQPEDDPAGIASLKIDGRPVDGWSAATLDPFLGSSGDFRKHLSGRQDVLSWRYLMLGPVNFKKSLVLKADRNQVGERLALFYLKN